MRAFIALDVSEQAKAEMTRIISELKKTGADVKWVDPENIHLTLKFLGEVDSHQIEEIKELIKRAAADSSKFSIKLSGLGAFPKPEYPRVIWVGVGNNISVMEKMATFIDEGCSPLGFQKDERAFSPHLTIGRVRSSANKDKLRSKMAGISVGQVESVVGKVVLYKSELMSSGPIYKELYSAALNN